MQTFVLDAPTPAGSQLSRRAAIPAVSRQVLTWLLFWPLLCMIAHQAPLLSGPAASKTGFAKTAGTEGAAFHIWLYSMLALQSAIVFPAWKSIRSRLRYHPLLIAVLVCMFASALWSSSPGNTVRIGIETALCAFFTLYLTVRLSPQRLMDLLIFMGVAASLLNLACALFLPSYGVFSWYAGGAWQGICSHKNTLGSTTAYLLTPIFFSRHHGRFFKWGYAALLLFLVYKSQSRGAWADAAAMLCFVAFLQGYRRLRLHESRLYVLAIFAIAALAVALVVLNFDTLAPAFGKDATMSGRGPIYAEIWSAIMKKPLLGYGYFGFWSVDPEAARVGIATFVGIGYAENGFLELALGLGFVGVALVGAMLVRAGIQAVALLRIPGARDRVGWYATLLFLAAMTNIDQGWLLMPYVLEWTLILVACIGLEEEWRRYRLRSTPRAYLLPAHDTL